MWKKSILEVSKQHIFHIVLIYMDWDQDFIESSFVVFYATDTWFQKTNIELFKVHFLSNIPLKWENAAFGEGKKVIKIYINLLFKECSCQIMKQEKIIDSVILAEMCSRWTSSIIDDIFQI